VIAWLARLHLQEMDAVHGKAFQAVTFMQIFYHSRIESFCLLMCHAEDLPQHYSVVGHVVITSH
jgi:hypothetical protein